MVDTTMPAAQATQQQPARTDTAQWRARIAKCKELKTNEYLSEWQTNVAYRKVKPFEGDAEADRVAIPVDWTQTKAKQAQLFSQVPTVMLTPKPGTPPPMRTAVPPFARKLNTTITDAKVGVAMDECLPDAINAAGIAAVLLGFDSRTQQKTLSKIDTKLLPPEAMQAITGNAELTDTAPDILDRRFYARRISPANLLWPTEFKGSDFDDAPWLGYSDRMLWAQAQVAFGLKDDDKQKICGASAVAGQDQQSVSDASTHRRVSTPDDGEVVEFDEIYYWCWRFDPECMSFCKLHRLVFVNGLETPVIDEPYKGQREVGGRYVGVVKNPIRVLTLTYISDEAIPPSDSSVGRAQVDELMKSRAQMLQQRDHSIPMRWFDVNRVDPVVIDLIMKGTWQGAIPVNGNGDKAIGEVARAQYPNQNFEFDRHIKDDLQQSWQVGPNQVGDFNEGERSASEANIVQANFQTRIGYERARVSSFFLGIAEVLAGLVALFADFDTPDMADMQRMGAWDRASIPGQFVYTIRTDSTVLLDSNQRLKKLNNFLNLTAKSGYVDIEPIIREMAALSGLDPDEVVKRPEPKGPEPATVTISASKEDVHDAIVLAMLTKAGYAPNPDEIEAAKQILIASVEPPKPKPQAPPVDGGPSIGGGAPPVAGGPIPQAVEDRMPDYNMMSRINQRKDSGLA